MSKDINIQSFEYKNENISDCSSNCVITKKGINNSEALLDDHIKQSRYNEIGQQKINTTNYSREFNWNNQEILIKNNNTSYYLDKIRTDEKYGNSINIWLNRIKPMYNMYDYYTTDVKMTDAEKRMIKIIDQRSYEPVRAYRKNNSEYIVYSALNSELIIKSDGQIRKMSYQEDNNQSTFIYEFKSENVEPIVRSSYFK